MNNLQKFELGLLIIALNIASFFGGHYFGKRGYDYELKTNPPSVEIVNKRPSDEKIDFAQFWDVYNTLNDKFLETPLDQKKLINGAIKGMVASTGDQFTSYFDPVENNQFESSLNGIYEGIGAELGYSKENQLMIISPIDGSPAKEAGILPGDKIIKINEESSYGMTLGQAVSKIRGKGGTSVKLTIYRDGKDPFDLDIVRNKITLKSVTWKDLGNGTAYFRISKFGSETNSQWDSSVKEANVKMKELDSVIIDVRGNPGGLLSSASYLSGEFFKNSAVIYFEDKFGKQVPLNSERMDGKFQNINNVVVLIDEGSASASEILAGALKINKNAKLVGKKSFGKGSIQQPYDFKDGGSLHVTVQKWLLPDKSWIHQKGINPDFEVVFDA
ncbi:MAG: S41 family peptidase, partial [Proteobacteria bacterium]|nr:S41 family peptidase [Pseudomonadota bacterium]